MTINELLALTGLTGSDEIPVWDAEASGEPTKKITAQNFAAAIKTLASLLGTGDVVNYLTSTATDKPLSAAMGKFLFDHYGKALWAGSAFTSGSINVPDLNKYVVFEFFFSDTVSFLVTRAGSSNIMWGGINYLMYGSNAIVTVSCRYSLSYESNTITIDSNNRGYSDGTNSNYSGKTDGLIRIVGIV